MCWPSESQAAGLGEKRNMQTSKNAMQIAEDDEHGWRNRWRTRHEIYSTTNVPRTGVLSGRRSVREMDSSIRECFPPHIQLMVFRAHVQPCAAKSYLFYICVYIYIYTYSLNKDPIINCLFTYIHLATYCKHLPTITSACQCRYVSMYVWPMLGPLHSPHRDSHHFLFHPLLFLFWRFEW